VVESSALLKRRSPKGYRGFESLPHRCLDYHGVTHSHYKSITLEHNKGTEIRLYPLTCFLLAGIYKWRLERDKLTLEAVMMDANGDGSPSP
jgi:hypothetical protein